MFSYFMAFMAVRIVQLHSKKVFKNLTTWGGFEKRSAVGPVGIIGGKIHSLDKMRWKKVGFFSKRHLEAKSPTQASMEPMKHFSNHRNKKEGDGFQIRNLPGCHFQVTLVLTNGRVGNFENALKKNLESWQFFVTLWGMNQKVTLNHLRYKTSSLWEISENAQQSFNGLQHACELATVAFWRQQQQQQRWRNIAVSKINREWRYSFPISLKMMIFLLPCDCIDLRIFSIRIEPAFQMKVLSFRAMTTFRLPNTNRSKICRTGHPYLREMFLLPFSKSTDPNKEYQW